MTSARACGSLSSTSYVNQGRFRTESELPVHLVVFRRQPLPRHQSGQRSMTLGIFGSGLLLVGCATTSDAQSDKLLSDAITIEREALACNRSVASEARYQNLTGLCH